MKSALPSLLIIPLLVTTGCVAVKETPPTSKVTETFFDCIHDKYNQMATANQPNTEEDNLINQSINLCNDKSSAVARSISGDVEVPFMDRSKAANDFFHPELKIQAFNEFKSYLNDQRSQ